MSRFFPRLLLVAVAAATLAACAGRATRAPEAAAPDAALLGTDWRQMAERPGDPAPAPPAVLRFEADRFTLSGPCNEHGGAWRQDGGRLQFGGDDGLIAATRKLCPPPVMEREAALLRALGGGLAARVDGPVLVLTDAAGRRWRFDSREQPPAEGRERILQVAGQRAPCAGGALCLQVREQPGAPWQVHAGEIEGFAWQVGMEYVLRIRELPVADAPAGAPTLRWVLVEELDRGPAR